MKVDDGTRQAAKEAAVSRPALWWLEQICEGLRSIEIPGELGEPSQAEYAGVERPGEIEVFVAEFDESVTFTPEGLRAHAFELLALAELVEAAGE